MNYSVDTSLFVVATWNAQGMTTCKVCFSLILSVTDFSVVRNLLVKCADLSLPNNEGVTPMNVMSIQNGCKVKDLHCLTCDIGV